MSASITPTELRAWADKRGTLQDDRTFFLAAADALEAAERRVRELTASLDSAYTTLGNIASGDERTIAVLDLVRAALDEVEP